VKQLEKGAMTMNRLCFGTFAKTIQKALQKPNSNQAVAELLLGLIAVADSNEPLTLLPKKVSALFNFKEDVQEEISSLASTPKIITAMPRRFMAKVIPCLKHDQIEDLKENLRKLINADTSIAQAKRAELLSHIDDGKNDLSEYLSTVFLYSLNKTNKNTTKDMDAEFADELTPMDDIARLNAIYARIPRPKAISIPDEPTDEELEYIAQLLAAYAEAMGIAELSRSNLSLYPKYNDDLRQRRKEYYAAETVRRSTRDVFKENDSDQFDLLKEETYDGIFDVYSQDYQHGFDRLLRVMTQVAAIQINKSSISKLPEWIGNKEKKGVCHILVNDKRIKWVVRDD
jgi:hypothetical protein